MKISNIEKEKEFFIFQIRQMMYGTDFIILQLLTHLLIQVEKITNRDFYDESKDLSELIKKNLHAKQGASKFIQML